MRAEGCVWLDGGTACTAGRSCGGRGSLQGSVEDLGGDIGGLFGVVTADSARHEEGVDEAKDGGDACPEEAEVKNAEAVSPDVKLVDAKVAEKDSEQDADNLVAASVRELGVEPGTLMVGHVGGGDRVDELHIVESPILQKIRGLSG